MHDVISRQAAIDELGYCQTYLFDSRDKDKKISLEDAEYAIEQLPSAQPEPSEITDEQAILHLQSTGWMQRHDKEMYESGLREQLADDSGSYDSLIPCEDTISRQAAIDAIVAWAKDTNEMPDGDDCIMIIGDLPSAQSEIVRCKDCEYGEQDDVGRWFCRSLGCQIGSEDGSGFCADAERRTDG